MGRQSLKNPCTKTGLAVTANIRQQLGAKEEEQRRIAEAKKDTEVAKINKRLLTREAEKAAGEELLSILSAGSSDWKKQKGDELRLAY